MPTKKSATPQYLSIEAAAEMLGLKRTTVRAYVAEGLLPGYRVGPRMIRLRLDDVEALIRPMPTVQRQA